jgi:hypothetical protein
VFCFLVGIFVDFVFVVELNRPLWILCVKWKMEGIDVNLDTTIGKWLSKFSSTVTRLAETQYANEVSQKFCFLQKKKFFFLQIIKNSQNQCKNLI